MVLYENIIFSNRKLLTLKYHKWKIKLFEERGRTVCRALNWNQMCPSDSDWLIQFISFSWVRALLFNTFCAHDILSLLLKMVPSKPSLCHYTNHPGVCFLGWFEFCFSLILGIRIRAENNLGLVGMFWTPLCCCLNTKVCSCPPAILTAARKSFVQLLLHLFLFLPTLGIQVWIKFLIWCGKMKIE